MSEQPFTEESYSRSERHEMANRLVGIAEALRSLGRDAGVADTIDCAARMLVSPVIGDEGPEAILPLTAADEALIVHTPLSGGPSRVLRGVRAPSSPSAPQARR